MSTTEAETTTTEAPAEPSFAASDEMGAESLIAKYTAEREDVPVEGTDETRPETMDEWKARTGYDHSAVVAMQRVDDQITVLTAQKAELEAQQTEASGETPPPDEPPPPDTPPA